VHADARSLDGPEPQPRPPDAEREGGLGPFRPTLLLPIAVGGVLGTLARTELGRLWVSGPRAFPAATFVTNVTGAALLGIFLGLLFERWPKSLGARLFLATGFCGAFTTFSLLVVQADLLVRAHAAGTALLYVVATVLVGLVAAAAGLRAGRWWGGWLTHRDPAPIEDVP
jgi:fluoride exporter